jgi:hypothetical protein
MGVFQFAIDWLKESPYERISLILFIANTIVQKTPWKGDDDVVAAAWQIFKRVVGKRK